MKFRSTTNSIRIRVRKSDLEQLKTNGEVYEKVTFPGGETWSFGLLIRGNQLNAHLDENRIVISLPQEIAIKWVNSDDVGIEEHLPLEGGEKLHLLLEKDFPCKTRDEDLSDTFFELDQGAC